MCVCVSTGKIFICDRRCFAHRNLYSRSVAVEILKPFCKIQRTDGRLVGDNLDERGEKGNKRDTSGERNGEKRETKRGREKEKEKKKNARECRARFVTHGRRSLHRVRRNRRADNLARSSHARGWKRKRNRSRLIITPGFSERKCNVIVGSFSPRTITQMSAVCARFAHAYCKAAPRNIKGAMSREEFQSNDY